MVAIFGNDSEGGQVSAQASIQDVLEGRATWAVIRGDCLEVLPTLPDKSVGVCIQDPPYSEHTHSKQRAGGADAGSRLPDGFARDRTLGFEHISQGQREAVAAELSRLISRWSLTFTDSESAAEWMRANTAAGLGHVRIGVWIKEGCTPQFTGDRPATGAEAVVISHPPGRKKWNGGGTRAVWSHPIVTGINPERTEHTTQKPLSLMLELVELFTDPGELVLDPFCGSGTTGVACLRLGRRFIGIERDEKYHQVAVDRLTAEGRGQSLRQYRSGQMSLLADIEEAKR